MAQMKNKIKLKIIFLLTKKSIKIIEKIFNNVKNLKMAGNEQSSCSKIIKKYILFFCAVILLFSFIASFFMVGYTIAKKSAPEQASIDIGIATGLVCGFMLWYLVMIIVYLAYTHNHEKHNLRN